MLGQAIRQALGSARGHPPLRPGAAADGRGEASRWRSTSRTGRTSSTGWSSRTTASATSTCRSSRTSSTRSSQNAGLDLHVELRYGKSPHHVVEAIFKGVARALRAGARARSARRRRAVGEGSVVAAVSAPPEIAVVDYGAGNLRSVAKALERSGLKVAVTSDPEALPRASGVVLPGVGTFADAAARACARSGLDEARARGARRGPPLPRALPRPPAALRGERRARRRRRASAGCAGASSASPPAAPDGAALRVPHIGWNRVRFRGDHPMIAGAARARTTSTSCTATARCRGIPSGSPASRTTGATSPRRSRTRGVFAVQFHPEKSQGAGKRLLDAFAAWVRGVVSDAGARALALRRSSLAGCAVETVRQRSYPRLEEGVEPISRVAVAPFGTAGDLAQAERRAQLDANVSIGAPAPEPGVGPPRPPRSSPATSPRRSPSRASTSRPTRISVACWPKSAPIRARPARSRASRTSASARRPSCSAASRATASAPAAPRTSGAASIWFEVDALQRARRREALVAASSTRRSGRSRRTCSSPPAIRAAARAGSRPRSSRAGAPRRRRARMPLGATAGPARGPDPWPASS